jgi:hypothetical protein
MSFLPTASGTYTLLELQKLRAGDEYPVVNEVIHRVPELNIFPTIPTDEQMFEVSVRTSKADVYFRNTNEGIPTSKTTFENKSFALQLIDGRIILDKKGLVNRSADQAARLMAQEMIAKAEGATQKLVDQLWYGVAVDPKGFPGMYELYDPTFDVDMPTFSGNADAGANSSLWLVEIGTEGPALYSGGGGQGLALGEFKEQLITDGSGNSLEGLYASLGGYFGFAIFNRYKAIRLKRIGVTGSGNELTDASINELLEKAEEIGMRPTHAFMTPRSRWQLQAARTATTILQNGTGVSAPVPTVLPNTDIPIISTINLRNDEETLSL